jgi:hypothetical protein
MRTLQNIIEINCFRDISKKYVAMELRELDKQKLD